VFQELQASKWASESTFASCPAITIDLAGCPSGIGLNPAEPRRRKESATQTIFMAQYFREGS
jgi:hypothetical protein